MKGLLKYLSPFAPDQSGAAAVFYDMDCITVVCDAGGCIGNYCGFDEPRWFEHKSPIFSAGLRDMDAILGRDDKMVKKLQMVAGKFGSKFAVLVGTPVPAVIGTDYKALKKMAEKKCGIPMIGIECTGTRLYDEGESDAYLKLFETFALPEGDGEDKRNEAPDGNVKERAVGIIGATPLDTSDIKADEKLREYYKKQGYSLVYCYGMRNGFEAVKDAGNVEKNVVLSPAGLKAAKYLKTTFGTPYEVGYPIIEKEIVNDAAYCGGDGQKILVVHQQAAANEMRNALRKKRIGTSITVGTFFKLDDELSEKGDMRFETEEAFREVVLKGGYDMVIADEFLVRAVKKYDGVWVDFPHFAVSGSLNDGSR